MGLFLVGFHLLRSVLEMDLKFSDRVQSLVYRKCDFMPFGRNWENLISK